MSEKKISFGFSKINKKPNILTTQAPIITKKIQLIECFEGKSIKIKDAVEIVHTPLVIPIQNSDKNLLERVEEAKLLRERSRKQYEPSKPNEPVDNRPDSELTLDELAARQLIKESQNLLKAVYTAAKVTIVAAVEDTLILEGSKEPTLDDYENVPIGDFGMAMLRGMGWKETKVDKDKKSATNATPELRPKGMGLGAYKLVNEEKPQKPAIDKEGKELNLVKGAFAKIIAGKHKGFYCKVEGLDDEAGRIIVKLAIKGVTLSLNEFLLTPVTKEEYSQSGKVLNISKYEEYKEKQDRQAAEIKVEKEESSTTKYNEIHKEQKTIKQERNRRYSSSEEKEVIKNKTKESSRDRRSRSYDEYGKNDRRSRSYEEYDKKQRVTGKNIRDNSPEKDKSHRKRNSSESSDSSDNYKKKSKKNKHKSRSDDRTKSKKKKSKKHRSRDSSTDSERRSKSVKSKERKSDKRDELSSDDERKHRKSSHKSSKHRR